MKPRLLLTLSFLPCLMAPCQGKTTGQEPTTDSPFAAALAEVNGQCPQDYPEVVTPLPETHDFDDIESRELMKMLESWNPSLRQLAAEALSGRGKEVMGVLRQGSSSDNWMVRAGSTAALAAIIRQDVSAAAPGKQEAIRKQYADVIGEFVRLTGDERLEVRVAALAGLGSVAPQGPEAVRAVLRLCDDPDSYLAQDAMITLEKHFSIRSLEQDEVIPALKAALGSSLPRGKGHIIRLIRRMSPEAQRQFIPELLAHLDWQPMRDTMFGAGGQEDAIQLLTRMEETRLVGRLPRLMGKSMRGPGLFMPCLDAAKAFGKDAKPILPELKAILADLEANGGKAEIQPRGDSDAAIRQLRQTIQHLESL